MASKQMIILILVTTMAKTFTVGDDKGWTNGLDYQNWAKGKQFRTGDKLVFKYQKGVHNVFKMDRNGLQQCIKPSANEAMTSGNDVITLSTTGMKWKICGEGLHCAGGQKLTIEVTANGSAARRRRSKNSGNKVQKFWIQVLVIATGIMLVLV